MAELLQASEFLQLSSLQKRCFKVLSHHFSSKKELLMGTLDVCIHIRCIVGLQSFGSLAAHLINGILKELSIIDLCSAEIKLKEEHRIEYEFSFLYRFLFVIILIVFQRG